MGVLNGERPYNQRGWPTWEQTVSQLLCINNGVLDIGELSLGAISHGAKLSPFKQILKKCSTENSRYPPIVPEDFEKLISSKTFTRGDIDCSRVKDNYRRNFGHATSCATKFDFQRLGWGDNEARAIAKVLPYCPNLETLYLRGNRISDAGGCALAAALHHCPKLKINVWDLLGNPMSTEMKRHLRGLTGVHRGVVPPCPKCHPQVAQSIA